RLHAVPVGLPGARAHLRPAGDVDRGTAHDERDARGRPHGRRPRRVRAGLAALHEHLPQHARRDRPRPHPQRGVGGPHAGNRRDDEGGSDQLLALRADAARQRRPLRRPQGQAVPRLRDLRLRSPGGRAGQLPRLRRHREAGALAHPAAVVHQPLGAAQDGRRTPALRLDRDQRLGGHRDGRGGPVSAHPTAAGGYQPVFLGKTREQLDTILKRYPNKQAALLPALWLVQEARGWISDRNMAEVAEVLALTPAYVKGVVTFYTMYHQHPVGRNFVQVCTTSPCNLCGAEGVVKAFLEHTAARDLGATSPDGSWTVIEVECLGACGFATPVLINDDFIESVTPEKVPALVRKYREGRR